MHCMCMLELTDAYWLSSVNFSHGRVSVSLRCKADIIYLCLCPGILEQQTKGCERGCCQMPVCLSQSKVKAMKLFSENVRFVLLLCSLFGLVFDHRCRLTALDAKLNNHLSSL